MEIVRLSRSCSRLTWSSPAESISRAVSIVREPLNSLEDSISRVRCTLKSSRNSRSGSATPENLSCCGGVRTGIISAPFSRINCQTSVFAASREESAESMGDLSRSRSTGIHSRKKAIISS